MELAAPLGPVQEEGTYRNKWLNYPGTQGRLTAGGRMKGRQSVSGNGRSRVPVIWLYMGL